MVEFIDRHRDAYGVESICAQLPIAPSLYYEHKAREADPTRLPPRLARDRALLQEIRRVYEENFRVYGAHKVWRQLTREDIAVARCTVERLMRQLGVRGVVRGKVVLTTFRVLRRRGPAAAEDVPAFANPVLARDLALFCASLPPNPQGLPLALRG